ncbi:MAG: aromatic ring-hydroxylating dioxygenase subunit alpha [Novosphingobium sp.]|nr:aromatic ring-hydroxylating dioxygenase subunit alpha [Novosphingobium sp.]
MGLYLKNCWYVAAFTDEVTRTPLARKLLDIPMVFYRKEDGTPVALVDRCPHRFAPLSIGRLVGDDIECGYHGLRFDCAGKCVSNPHNAGKALSAADIESFTLFERYGFVWIWPGEAALADTATIPHFPYLEDDSTWRVLRGHLEVKGNYQLVSDNLLDLTHAPYLHPGFKMPGVTPEQQLAATTTSVEKTDRSVHYYRHRNGLPPNQATIDLFGFPAEPAISRTHMHWYPPALIDFDNGTYFEGQAEMDGFCFPQAHCMTPETEITCHYFFAAARNLKIDDPAIDDALRGVLNTAFRTQDEPMIEAVQSRMGNTGDIEALGPVMLKTDAAPVMARRLLKQMIADEQAGEIGQAGETGQAGEARQAEIAAE